MSHLAMRLSGHAFVREERVPLGPMYILRRGLCSRGWRFFGPGRVWGEDMIIDRPHLLDHRRVSPRARQRLPGNPPSPRLRHPDHLAPAMVRIPGLASRW